MTFFLWFMLALHVLDVLGRAVQLGTGKLEPRTPSGEAFNMVFNGSVAAWIAVLLASH